MARKARDAVVIVGMGLDDSRPREINSSLESSGVIAENLHQ